MSLQSGEGRAIIEPFTGWFEKAYRGNGEIKDW